MRAAWAVTLFSMRVGIVGFGDPGFLSGIAVIMDLGHCIQAWFTRDWVLGPDSVRALCCGYGSGGLFMITPIHEGCVVSTYSVDMNLQYR